MKDFKNKVLVITGAGSGIGAALAREGVKRGMKVVLNDIDPKGLENTAKELRNLGGEFAVQAADISIYENVQSLLKLTLNTFGQVDMLCNNAGVTTGASIWEVPVQDIRWVNEVNLLSHLYGMNVFIPQMIKQGTEAVVVNTESAAGVMISGTAVLYHATKHAGVAASESTSISLRQHGLDRIHVHCLVPSFIKTTIHLSDQHRPERYAVNEDPYYSSEPYKSGLRRSAKAVLAGTSVDYVGECVFSAVEENRFYIFTHPEIIIPAGDRVMNMVNGKNPDSTYAL